MIIRIPLDPVTQLPLHGWVLQLHKWTALWELVGDLSWACVNFVKSDGKKIPKKPGIYMLCAAPPEFPERMRRMLLDVLPECSPQMRKRLCDEVPFLRNVMYVGETKNLHGRFNQHIRGTARSPSAKFVPTLKSCFSTGMVFCYAPHENGDKKTLLRIEKAAQHCFRPGAVYPVPSEPEEFQAAFGKERDA